MYPNFIPAKFYQIAWNAYPSTHPIRNLNIDRLIMIVEVADVIDSKIIEFVWGNKMGLKRYPVIVDLYNRDISEPELISIIKEASHPDLFEPTQAWIKIYGIELLNNRILQNILRLLQSANIPTLAIIENKSSNISTSIKQNIIETDWQQKLSISTWTTNVMKHHNIYVSIYAINDIINMIPDINKGHIIQAIKSFLLLRSKQQIDPDIISIMQQLFVEQGTNIKQIAQKMLSSDINPMMAVISSTMNSKVLLCNICYLYNTISNRIANIWNIKNQRIKEYIAIKHTLSELKYTYPHQYNNLTAKTIWQIATLKQNLSNIL